MLGWLHTGDIGFFNEHGEVFFSYRIKDEIRYSGVTPLYLIPGIVIRISGNELKRILETHTDVLEAVVVGVPGNLEGEVATGFVRTVSGSQAY